MYLSLSSSYVGYACGIKQSIINYTNYTGPTHFFDWLVVSMKSINQILENTPIEFENEVIYPNDLNTTTIKFKNFHLLISHHDIHEFNDNSINELTEKYIRRYERLIDTIKKQQYICFIRYCKNSNDIESDEIIAFYKNIGALNPSLVFKIILISDCENLTIPSYLFNYNLDYINLNNYIDDEILNETNEYHQIIKKYKYIFKNTNYIFDSFKPINTQAHTNNIKLINYHQSNPK
jgi:hypothetical protein